MESGDIITSARDFIRIVKNSDEVKLKFVKKTTNEVRIMRCTLKFDNIPSDKRPKTFDLDKVLKLIVDNKILHVYDLDKNEWRSVPFDRTEWVQDTENKIMYKIAIK